MASHTGLRQASRLVQSNKSYLAPSRLRQYSQSTAARTLLSSQTSSFSRNPRIRTQHVLQQSRNLSWWGSGASTSPSPPSQPATPSSNLDISEPSDLQNIITPDRSFKASSDISSVSSAPNSLEPQFLEDVQRTIAEPHLTDPAPVPENLEDIPERVGYLKEVCGLDFGWGPTSTVQFVLEHLHITGAFSWTASIVLLGVAVRAIVFPALVGAAKETQKMRDVKDVLGPIQAEYTAAKEKGDQTKQAQAAQRLMAVRKDFNLQLWRVFLPPLLQIPFGFGCWRLLRNSAQLPVPGFVTESWLWTTDLTFSDPYFITPALSAFLIWATMSVNKRVNSTPATQGLITIFLKALPALTFVFMTFQPGAVQLYFVASSTVGLVSAMILQVKSVRKFFNMPPLAPVASTKIPQIVTRLTDKVTGKPPGAVKATAVAPPVVKKAIGGLHRTTRAERIAEAERAARLDGQQGGKGKKGPIGKMMAPITGYLRRHGTEFSSAGKGIFGQVKSMTGSAKKSAAGADAESYEWDIQQRLDRQRQARNERNRGGR